METSPSPNQPPPGWYADPKMAGTQRYWSGAEWTDHVAPGTPASQVPSQHATNDTLAVAGWITAVFLPLVGFIIGCVLLTRRPAHGAAMMALAMFAAVCWFYLI